MQLVAFDSNVLTAFLRANTSSTPESPGDVAAYRLFLYELHLTILPTVTKEAARIPANDTRREHLRWIWYQFPEAQLQHAQARIDARVPQLLEKHRDPDDCRIVAEAEAANVEVLATSDKDLRKHLQRMTSVVIETPGEIIGRLPAGAEPHRQPASGHPLASATWWRL
jgi:predicted nucleic acid-binding protein